MGYLDIAQTGITDLNNKVKDFEVDTGNIDQANTNKTYWDYPNAGTDLGYYKYIPEIKAIYDTLALYVGGLGFTTDSRTKVILDKINGWGEDDFTSIILNALVMSYALGDSFTEIVRAKDNRLINLKPLYTGDMRVIVNNFGIVTGYEQRITGKNTVKFNPNQILHIVEGRVANEIHGNSKTEALKWIVDAKNEAMDTKRKVERRRLAMGILEVDTENATKLAAIKSQYQDAVNKGEVLVTIKGLSEVKSSPQTTEELIAWLNYLDSKFYEVAGVPRVLVTSEGFTEAGGKTGLFTFSPIYTHRQVKLEADLWKQVGIKVKFNQAPSITGKVQDDQQKNTGQLGLQQNDVEVSI